MIPNWVSALRISSLQISFDMSLFNSDVRIAQSSSIQLAFD